jgi:hypothetical protein
MTTCSNCLSAPFSQASKRPLASPRLFSLRQWMIRVPNTRANWRVECHESMCNARTSTGLSAHSGDDSSSKPNALGCAKHVLTWRHCEPRKILHLLGIAKLATLGYHGAQIGAGRSDPLTNSARTDTYRCRC